MATLLVHLTNSELQDLEEMCAQSGKSKNEIVRALLSESLKVFHLRQSMNKAQGELGAAAAQAGWLNEEDILQDVS